MLELDAVAKSFRSRSGVVTAVRDLTLAVPEGAFLTLLGPSGSGKTTALRCVAGLERPDRGLIEIDGTVVADPERGIQVPADRRAIGMVFQSPTVWPHMSVWQNVAFPLLSGRRRSRPSRGEVGRMVGQALERVRLEGLDRRPATDLSGGQQQRLALARALARSPRLLLLDEPLSALDAPLRVEIGVELLRVQRELGLTTVYVTHDQDEALSLSTHVAVVREGTIEQVGTPRELYERPASGSVARALGPANLMPGKVVGSDNGCAVVDTVHGRLRVGLNGASGLGAAGSPVFVMARPEHVRVERGRGEGRVLSESFVRDAVELIVENRDEQLRVRLPASDAVGQGTVVAVEFDEGRLRLVPGGGRNAG